MAEWKSASLRDVGVTLIDCVHKTPEAATTGYPYVGIPQMKNGRIDFSTARLISHEDYLEWTKKAKPQKHDVILSRRTNPGVTAIEDTGTKFALGQNLVLLRADGTQIHPPFLKWMAQSPYWWGQIAKFNNVGAVFDSLKCADVPNFELPVPPREIQISIAGLLDALDDKIELNRRMNETLEATARAIFRDWFIDFGPTRTKMAMRGEDPKKENTAPAPYLAPDLWSLFPGRLDDEGKPEGWSTRPVGEFADFRGGKQLQKEHIYPTGKIPVFGGAGIMGYTCSHNADGFVIAVGRVGAYCGKFFSHRGKAWINNNASLIKQKESVPGEWLFQALKHVDIDLIKKGAAQPFVSNTDIAGIPIIWPGERIISHFSEILLPIILKIEHNVAEAATLASTRDLLLPKLMSGEVRVRDPEKFNGGAT